MIIFSLALNLFTVPKLAKRILFGKDLHVVLLLSIIVHCKKLPSGTPQDVDKLLITKEAYWRAQLFSFSPFGLNKRLEFHSENRKHYFSTF